MNKNRSGRPRKGVIQNAPTEAHFTNQTLAKRWACCTATARRRAEKLGVPKIRLSQRSALYRLSDVVAAENRCAV